MTGFLGGLVVLLALICVSCGDDESTFKTENCASVVALSGETFTLCCRVKCVAEYDYNEYSEQCTEETTCTAQGGGGCPLIVVQTFQPPPCLY